MVRKNHLLILFLTLVGCQGRLEDPKHPPICQVSMKTTVEEALKNPLFEKGHWPQENWWEVFQDKSLTEYIDQALENNPGYLATQERIQALEEEAKVVFAKLFPHLALDGNLLWAHLPKQTIGGVAPHFPPTIHPLTMLFNLSYEFDFWGKNRKKFEAAIGAVKTQEAMHAQAKLTISSLLSESYFDIQSALEKRAIYEEMLRDQEMLLELMVMKQSSRIENQIAVNRTEQVVKELNQSLAIIEEEISLKKHAIQTLIGKEVEEDFSVAKNWRYQFHPGKLPEFLGSDLLARRPEIIAKIWQVRSASKLVGVAQTEFLPNINLSAGGGFQSFEFNQFFDKHSLVGFLLPAFEIPIFTGGRLQANLDAKMASYRQQVLEYNDLVLNAVQDVANKISHYASISQQLEEEAEKEQLIFEDLKLVQLRVERGLNSVMDFIEVKQRYLREQSRLVDLQRGYYQAWIQLIKSLGGGYHAEEGVLQQNNLKN